MSERFEEPAAQIKHLQRCINDLVSVLALPAMWTGSEPSRIVQTLIDSLVSILRLDVVYVRLKDPDGTGFIEMAKIAQSPNLVALAQPPGEILNRSLGDVPWKWPPKARVAFGEAEISIATVRLGLHDEIGVIAAGADRADFPGQTETLLLSVAANQTAIGLQEARLLTEQKRVAGELDRRVRSEPRNWPRSTRS